MGVPLGFRAMGTRSRRAQGGPGTPRGGSAQGRERGPCTSKAPLTLWELLRLNSGVSHQPQDPMKFGVPGYRSVHLTHSTWLGEGLGATTRTPGVRAVCLQHCTSESPASCESVEVAPETHVGTEGAP